MVEDILGSSGVLKVGRSKMKPAKLATRVTIYINSHTRGISATALATCLLVRDVRLDFSSHSQSVIHHIIPWYARLFGGANQTVVIDARTSDCDVPMALIWFKIVQYFVVNCHR